MRSEIRKLIRTMAGGNPLWGAPRIHGELLKLGFEVSERTVSRLMPKHPTAEWTAQQIIEAFPEDAVPRYLIRDRDGVYGNYFRNRVQGMGIQEVLTAPKSPWQNPFAERFIGSIRRECLNHVIVLGERHLRWTLKRYFRYYLDSRTHLSLEKDSPDSRSVQSAGEIIAIPQVGGLHHRYNRHAA